MHTPRSTVGYCVLFSIAQDSTSFAAAWDSNNTYAERRGALVHVRQGSRANESQGLSARLSRKDRAFGKVMLLLG